VNNSITTTGTIMYKINNGTFNIYANNSEYSPTFISTSGSLATGESTTISLNFSRLFNLVIYREETGELFNLSDTNETNISIIVEVICSTKKQTYNILTNPSLIPNLSCNWRQEDNNLNLGWKISVDYPTIPTGDTYFRFINPNTTDTNVEAYLMDLNAGDEIVETILSLNDLANQYESAIFTAERTINNTVTEVLSQKVDIGSSVQFWMDQNANYYIYIIDDNGKKTELKYLVAEQESTKTVVVPSIDLEAGMDFQDNDYRIQLSANKFNGSATVKVTDFKSIGYDTLQWQIYLLTPTVNVSNQSLAVQNGFYNELSVFNVTLVDGYNITYIINSSLYPLFANQSYSSRIIVTLTNGDIIATNGTVLWYSTPYTGFDGFESFAADIKMWFALIAILMVILGFSALSMELGFGMALVTSWIFYMMGWLLPLQTRIPVFGQNNIFWLLSLFSLLEGIMLWRMLQKKT
jgi:hypothetical protein